MKLLRSWDPLGEEAKKRWGDIQYPNTTMRKTMKHVNRDMEVERIQYALEDSKTYPFLHPL